LADAANIGGQHRVRAGEWRACVQIDVGRQVAQLVDAGNAFSLQCFRRKRADGDGHLLQVFAALLSSYDDLFQRSRFGLLRDGRAAAENKHRKREPRASPTTAERKFFIHDCHPLP